MTYAFYECRCGKPFKARTADRNRGWAKFCSKSCKAIEQEGRTGQYRRLQERQDSDSDNDLDGMEVGWDAHKEWL